MRLTLSISIRLRFHFADVSGRATIRQVSEIWDEPRYSDDWMLVSGGTTKGTTSVEIQRRTSRRWTDPERRLQSLDSRMTIAIGRILVRCPPPSDSMVISTCEDILYFRACVDQSSHWWAWVFNERTTEGKYTSMCSLSSSCIVRLSHHMCTRSVCGHVYLRIRTNHSLMISHFTLCRSSNVLKEKSSNYSRLFVRK